VDEATISLPSDLAAELVAEQLVDEPVVWRGADVVSLVTLAADVTSAVTAVLVSRSSIAAVVQRFVHHAARKAGDAPEVCITVKVGKNTSVLVEENDPAGLTRLTVVVAAAAKGAEGLTESS
jgi:hypothetical protein